jgi:hypothetical protein
MKAPPTEAVTLGRARTFANEAMFTVALQLRRVASDDPEDSVFVLRRWVDWQFLIVALRRLQRAAELAAKTPTGAKFVAPALTVFRREIPGLTTMRNVLEHFDSYALDDPDRRHKAVDRRRLQSGTLSGDHFVWLGHELHAEHVKATAEALYDAVRSANRSLRRAVTVISGVAVKTGLP